MIQALLLATVIATQGQSQLTLAQVVDRALASHPSVAVARAQRDHAAAELGEATATRLPRVTFDATVNQFQQPMVVAPLHRFDPRNPPLFDRTLVQSGLSATWIAFDFGSRRAYVRAERSLEQAADIAISTTQMQLMARTVSVYLDVLTARETLVARDERLAALSQERKRVNQLLEVGKAARIDELRVNAELKRSEADRIAAAARLDGLEHMLADLAELPFAAVHAASLARLRLADTTLAADTSASRTSALQRNARLTNTQLRELEQRVKSAEAATSAIRATGWPELRLSGGYVDRGRASGDFAAEWQLGVGVSYPVYGGGSHGSAVRKAAADARATVEQLRLAELNVNAEVDRALASVREAHAMVNALQSAVDQATEVTRIERLSLDVGSGTQSDFFDAEANELRSRAALIEVRHAEISARVELARIVGELTRDWLTRTVEAMP